MLVLYRMLDVNHDSGFEVGGKAVLKDRDFRDQALDQRFVKLRDGGGLTLDEINADIAASREEGHAQRRRRRMVKLIIR